MAIQYTRKKNVTAAVGLDVRFEHLNSVTDIDAFLRTAIHDIIDDVVLEMNENKVVGVSVSHPELSDPILYFARSVIVTN